MFFQHAERRNVPAVYEGTKAGKQLRGSNSNWPGSLFSAAALLDINPTACVMGKMMK